MNTFGHNLRLTTFGESHGKAIGGIIDGFPSGFKIDFEALMKEVNLRKPGSSLLVTQRNESDIPEFLSGISEEGVTLGTSIGFIIRNTDNRGKDYSELAEKFRPNHADFTYESKYGIRDYKGGGRASARETANWVVAGALAQQWLRTKGIEITSVLTGAGKLSYSSQILNHLSINPFDDISSILTEEMKKGIEEEIKNAKNQGDSVGGTVTCLINGIPVGVGNPVADKLQSQLAASMLSINAVKGFEYGLGMESALYSGSQILDIFTVDSKGKVITKTNFSGGIQGGITNGMPVFFNVAFKPTPTIMKELETITKSGQETVLKMRGRHDPCVAVRGVPVVRAMAALVVADNLL